jgi:hypothetical protein
MKDSSMRKLIWLLCLSAFLIPARAWAWCPPPLEVDAGINAYFNVKRLDYHASLGPWYTYWPQEAHFQLPAPIGGQYPNWPSPWPPGASQPEAFAAPPLQSGPENGPSMQPGPVMPPATPAPPAGAWLRSPASPFQPVGAWSVTPYRPVVYPRAPVGYYYYQAPSYWYGY